MSDKIKPQLIPPHLKAFYDAGRKDFVAFWENAAIEALDEIYWFRGWDKTFSWDGSVFKWFEGGITNVCYNCLDKNIEKGRAGRAALVFESGETGESRTVTYAELLDIVKRYAAALRGMGVKKGDRVALYIPTCIESVAMMLACARIGAIHVVIFAGFSSKAINDRLKLSGARFVITQDEGRRRGKVVPLKNIMDDALKDLSSQVEKVVVLRKFSESKINMQEGRDIFMEEFLKLGDGMSSEVEPVESNDPLFLLPTSGTTAMPKVTVHKHGGYQVYIHSMAKWIYGLSERDVWFCTSDIGWIVGHSYNVYAPLIAGATSVLYEGTPDYPEKDMWWRIIEKYKVTGLWTSPTGIRGLMKLGTDQAKKHDLSTVERILSAGEVLNPAAWKWIEEDVFEGKIPVIDHMWQTESSGPLIANPYGITMIPVKPGSAGIPAPGVTGVIMNQKTGEILGPNEKGVLVIEHPFPGLTSTIWGDHERYMNEYWGKIPGKRVYYTGDAAYMDEDGYIWFVGRSDEVIKISAHRIGAVEIENALISHPAVVESGVSGVPDELKGEVACAFVVLREGYEPTEELKKELLEHVRKAMGKFVVLRDIEFVNMLPKTRSGKIMRRVMKALWMKKDLGDLSTIEEEASIEEIMEAIKKMKSLKE